MYKILLKKQMTEFFRGYFVNKKTGKIRSKGGIVGFFILFAFIMLILCGIFFVVSSTLAYGLLNKLDWLYFAMMGLIAMGLGTFGSVFNTYAGIYHSKDNELLLSMPIKPSDILLSRISGVYILGLMYEAVVFVPAMIAYWIFAKPTFSNVFIPIILLFVLAFFISALTCLLGWIVALISSKIKSKSFVTVFISLVVFGLYYFVCMRLNNILSSIVQNAEKISHSVKTAIYPAYCFGKAATGNWLYFLLFTVFSFACFGLTYYIMTRSFVKITTIASSDKKTKHKEKSIKTKSIKSTLFYKELKRFTASPTYMMNCGLGLVVLPILAIVAIFKANFLRQLVSSNLPITSDMFPMLIVGIVCLLVSANDISAPSISLEGRNIWILQSVPVDTFKILEAKIRLHTVLNTVSALIPAIIFGVIFKMNILQIALICVTVWLYIRLMGTLGVVLNLKMPNLTWTNETSPIKQSLPVTILLFGGWIFTALTVALCFITSKFIDATIFIGILSVVYVVAIILLNRWLRKKGTVLFSELKV